MTVGGLVLFHGAGGDRNHETFLALEKGLDHHVARVNFPYRQKGPGRRPPDRMPKLIQAVRAAVDEHGEEWGLAPEQLVIGGRSMGGRAASMAIAEGLAVGGLLLMSYPLHPPGKPDKLRVEHLDQVKCPTLLIQGTRDPFGKPAEFTEHFGAIAGPLTEVWVDGNHSPKGHDDHIVASVAGWMSGL